VLKEIIIKSTSHHSADCDPIILRKKDTVRLIFRPAMVDNPHNQFATVRGEFIYQKKAKKDEWVDCKTLNLSDLKKDEFVKLELHAQELFEFVSNVISLYKISHKDGVPFGEARYLKIDGELSQLGKLSEEDLRLFFTRHKKDGYILLTKLVELILSMENPEILIDRLKRFDSNDLNKLSSWIGLSNLDKFLEIWTTNQKNPQEEFWQGLFVKNNSILAQLFSFPVVFVQDKAYLGGKSFDNKGGELIDFLFKNSITSNAVLIEIKSPAMRFLGSEYRNNVYNISGSLTGAVMQLINYRHTLVSSYYDTIGDSQRKFESFHPQCVLIAGNIGNELDDQCKKRSFEYFRNNLKDIQIISFDEVFGKIEKLVELLKVQNCDFI